MKFSFLQGLNYAILHGWQRLPEHLPSDLDIIIAPTDLHWLERTLVSSKVCMVNLLQHESTCYYFISVVPQKDHKVWFLPLDTATDYRRDGRVWFSAEELFAGRQRWKDFWVASPAVEFKYLLVKKILKGAFPPHGARRLEYLADTLGKEADTLAEGLLGQRWGAQVMDWIRNGDWEQVQAHVPALKRALKWQRLRQDPLNPLRYWLPEIPRIWRRWRYPTGLWVAVLGPDGAGKSTLIANLRQELGRAFRRTAAFHLMPGLLRRQGDGAPVTDPHGRPPRPWLVSLLKLAYYGLEYTLGYWLKIRPALARSTLVLFDRYYEDVLVDPRRYRYGGPVWVARLLCRFIPGPDLWLILDAPEEAIVQRKREVPLEEVRRQREGYRRLALALPNTVLLDAVQPPEEVAREARDAVLTYLHARYVRRRRVWFKEATDVGLLWLQQALGGAEGAVGQRFLYLPLPDGRGYLLPTGSRQAAVQGLDLYQPQKTTARGLKKLVQWGLRGRVARLLLRKVEIDLAALLDFLGEVFAHEDLTVAASLGTPGPHRKPVLQVLTAEGEVLGYVKVGWNAATQALVRNEAEVLRTLQEKERPFLTPQVRFAGEWEGRFLCVQSPPPRGAGPAPRMWGSLYQQALEGMASLGVTRRRLVTSDFWQRLEQRVAQMPAGYRKRTLLQEMKRIQQAWGDQVFPFHLAHGDFAPWNAQVMDGWLYLYDWEYAEEMPAGYDLFHFWTQTLSLVEGRKPTEIVAAVAARWDGDACEEGLRLFRLYLLARLSQAGGAALESDTKRLLGLLWAVGGAG